MKLVSGFIIPLDAREIAGRVKSDFIYTVFGRGLIPSHTVYSLADHNGVRTEKIDYDEKRNIAHIGVLKERPLFGGLLVERPIRRAYHIGTVSVGRVEYDTDYMPQRVSIDIGVYGRGNLGWGEMHAGFAHVSHAFADVYVRLLSEERRYERFPTDNLRRSGDMQPQLVKELFHEKCRGKPRPPISRIRQMATQVHLAMRRERLAPAYA